MKNNGARAFAGQFLIFSMLLAATALLLIYAVVFAYRTWDDGASKGASAEPDPVLTVILDAGHGGEDGGAVGKDGTAEKELNLSIATMLSDMLRASGVKVIMTRTEDVLLYDRNVDYKGRKKSLDLRARLEVANANPDALFVSIHMNAFPNKKYSGLQVYYSKNAGESRALAENIQSTVKTLLQPENDRKIKKAGSSIYLLDRAPGIAVLVECGFLSNDEECEKLCTVKYRRQLAFALFDAICSFR